QAGLEHELPAYAVVFIECDDDVAGPARFFPRDVPNHQIASSAGFVIIPAPVRRVLAGPPEKALDFTQGHAVVNFVVVPPRVLAFGEPQEPQPARDAECENDMNGHAGPPPRNPGCVSSHRPTLPNESANHSFPSSAWEREVCRRFGGQLLVYRQCSAS